MHVGRVVFIQEFTARQQNMSAMALDSRSLDIADTALSPLYNYFQDQEKYGLHPDGFGLPCLNAHRICHPLRSRSIILTNQNIQPAKVVFNQLPGQYPGQGRCLLPRTYVCLLSHLGAGKGVRKEKNS